MDGSKETVRLVRLRIAEIRTQRKRRRRILGATAVAVCVCIVVLAIVATLRLYRPAGVELADPPLPMGSMEEEYPAPEGIPE